MNTREPEDSDLVYLTKEQLTVLAEGMTPQQRSYWRRKSVPIPLMQRGRKRIEGPVGKSTEKSRRFRARSAGDTSEENAERKRGRRPGPRPNSS